MKGSQGKADQQKTKRTIGIFASHGTDCRMDNWEGIHLPGRCAGSFGAIVLVFIVIAYLSTPVLAGEWLFVPKIGLYGGYDDNVFFSKQAKTSSSIINIEPAFTLDYESLLSSLRLAANWDIVLGRTPNDPEHG